MAGYAGRSGGMGVCVSGGYNPIGLVGMWRVTRGGASRVFCFYVSPPFPKCIRLTQDPIKTIYINVFTNTCLYIYIYMYIRICIYTVVD